MQKITEGTDAGSYIAVSTQQAIIVSADDDGHFLISQTIGDPESSVTEIICVTSDAMPTLIASLQEIKRRADIGLFDSRIVERKGDAK